MYVLIGEKKTVRCVGICMYLSVRTRPAKVICNIVMKMAFQFFRQIVIAYWFYVNVFSICSKLCFWLKSGNNFCWIRVCAWVIISFDLPESGEIITSLNYFALQKVTEFSIFCTYVFKRTVSWDWGGLKLSWLDNALPLSWPHFVFILLFHLNMS
jgi:hypothetical protein